MNQRALVFLFLAFAMPLAASAQTPAGPPSQADSFRQFGQQVATLRRTERASILAAITPGHRNAIGTIAGQLITQDQPDVAAAASQIDALLSPSEKTAVLNAYDGMVKQMQDLMSQNDPMDLGAGGFRAPGEARDGATKPSAGRATLDALLAIPRPLPRATARP